MQKAIYSTISSFAAGCMIFMVSTLIPYWENSTEVFEEIQKRYDSYVLGIFIVAIVVGGVGHYLYQLKVPFNVKVLLHYGTTIFTVIVISIWLNIIKISLSQIISYGITTTIIFIIGWYVNYMHLKREATKINALLEQRSH